MRDAHTWCATQHAHSNPLAEQALPSSRGDWMRGDAPAWDLAAYLAGKGGGVHAAQWPEVRGAVVQHLQAVQPAGGTAPLWLQGASVAPRGAGSGAPGESLERTWGVPLVGAGGAWVHQGGPVAVRGQLQAWGEVPTQERGRVQQHWEQQGETYQPRGAPLQRVPNAMSGRYLSGNTKWAENTHQQPAWPMPMGARQSADEQCDIEMWGAFEAQREVPGGGWIAREGQYMHGVGYRATPPPQNGSPIEDPLSGTGSKHLLGPLQPGHPESHRALIGGEHLRCMLPTHDPALHGSETSACYQFSESSLQPSGSLQAATGPPCGASTGGMSVLSHEFL
jgi:hypothetical protein